MIRADTFWVLFKRLEYWV